MANKDESSDSNRIEVPIFAVTLTTDNSFAILGLAYSSSAVRFHLRNSLSLILQQPHCQPEMAFGPSFTAQQSTNPTDNDTNLLNRCLSWQIRNSTRGLKFIPLDLDTLKIVAFTDSSFANNHDFSSQIGFVIALTDVNNNANIIHWTSVKSRRVTRSVLASELYAMSLGFDAATTIKATLDQILSKR